MGYLIAAISILVVGNYVNKHWRVWYYRNDPVLPDAPKRDGLYFGYFGCTKDQVVETKGHVNVLVEVQFEPESTIKHIRESNTAVMLGLSPYLLDRPDVHTKFTVRPDAEQRLRDHFTALRLAGVLHFVVALSPIDEPNNTVGNVDELTKAVSVIRKVAAEYAELKDYKLYVVYAADKDFIGRDMFDWIGFDDYDMKGSVLTGKQYKELRDSLFPDQKTIIIPGGAYGQDPVPFCNYAKASVEVAVVMPFLWADDQGEPGIRSNGMAAHYINAGKSVI